jgi:uncharacterized protein YcbK (DUF882 family)
MSMKAVLALCSILVASAPAYAEAEPASVSKQRVGSPKLQATSTAKNTAKTAPLSWRTYKKKGAKRGFVHLQSTVGAWDGHVLGRRNEILPQAKTAFSRVFASWRTGKRCEVNPRLISVVVKLSDTFGGRTIHVASGYREHSYYQDSRHRTGDAVDLSVEGVPNEFLRDYLRTFHGVAVGYYPNSSFVHLDVRGYSAYWVDYARPGEPPQSQVKRRRAAKPANAQSKRDGSRQGST